MRHQHRRTLPKLERPTDGTKFPEMLKWPNTDTICRSATAAFS